MPIECTPDGGPKAEFVKQFKDKKGRIKRQGAQFRIFRYDSEDDPGREITLNDSDVASIAWTVQDRVRRRLTARRPVRAHVWGRPARVVRSIGNTSASGIRKKLMQPVGLQGDFTQPLGDAGSPAGGIAKLFTRPASAHRGSIV